jgi:hypothetical protein
MSHASPPKQRRAGTRHARTPVVRMHATPCRNASHGMGPLACTFSGPPCAGRSTAWLSARPKRAPLSALGPEKAACGNEAHAVRFAPCGLGRARCIETHPLSCAAPPHTARSSSQSVLCPSRKPANRWLAVARQQPCAWDTAHIVGVLFAGGCEAHAPVPQKGILVRRNGSHVGHRVGRSAPPGACFCKSKATATPQAAFAADGSVEERAIPAGCCAEPRGKQRHDLRHKKRGPTPPRPRDTNGHKSHLLANSHPSVQWYNQAGKMRKERRGGVVRFADARISPPPRRSYE